VHLLLTIVRKTHKRRKKISQHNSSLNVLNADRHVSVHRHQLKDRLVQNCLTPSRPCLRHPLLALKETHWMFTALAA